MNILEEIYTKQPKNIQFYPRKCKLEYGKNILSGTNRAGMSQVLIDYFLSLNPNNVLYIDLNDIRVSIEYINNYLFNFIKEKDINHLIIDHYHESVNLPNLQDIKLGVNKDVKINGYSNIYLFPLDFEEFVSFNKKNLTTENLLANFINTGNQPEFVVQQDENKIQKIQHNLQWILKDENIFRIFKYCTFFASSFTSMHQIFENIKLNHKLSKDFFYFAIKGLQETNSIFLVEKYLQPRADKKLYIWDFYIKNALSFQRDFIKQFENMIFCELLKLKTQIYYLDGIDFFMPNEHNVILSTPFLPVEFIQRKFSKLLPKLKQLEIKNIIAISMGNRGEIKLDNISCEILPFWEWALQL